MLRQGCWISGASFDNTNAEEERTLAIVRENGIERPGGARRAGGEAGKREGGGGRRWVGKEEKPKQKSQRLAHNTNYDFIESEWG